MGELLHFEDFTVGQVFELGERTVSQEEMIEFGHEWDPLPFHIDPELAADGPYGGLIASGRHSGVIFHRLTVDALLSRAAGMGSPGLDSIAWHVPLRPGDTLHARLTVTALQPSATRADRGTLHFDGELLNQNDENTTTIRGRCYLRRRGTGA